MADITSDGVKFHRYLDLSRSFYAAIEALIVFDNNANIVWQSYQQQHVQIASISEKVKSYQNKSTSGEINSICDIESADRQIELINMRGEYDEVLLTLCFVIKSGDGAAISPLCKNKNINLLNEGLLKEYLQGLELKSKEDELNMMTEELTRRYEELNLVYKSDDQAQNRLHGKELLKQIATHTLNFLEVELVFMAMPEKNFSLHKFKEDQLIFDAEKLLNYLNTDVYQHLKHDKEAIVFNHRDDASRLGLEWRIPYKLIVNPIVNADKIVIGFISIINRHFNIDFTNSDRNLLEVMAKKASKIAQSNFDLLTGLENNHSFTLIVNEALRQSRLSEVCHAIANIDIDRLSVVNEISGLEAGDILIKKVGLDIANMVRTGDVVARLGSDKFGVYLENCDLETAESVMSKIARKIAEINFEWQNKHHEVSISIGIAPVNANSQSVAKILNAAESARDLSKEYGRNKIHVFELEDRELLKRQENIHWVGRIQKSLRDNRFELYSQLIQPINPDKDPPHFEILVRMIDDDGGVIAPGRFLPAAEHFFLMPRLDRWVVEQAFRMLAEYSQGPGQALCHISINLSGQSLGNGDSLDLFISDNLEKYQLDAGAICFEVTESSAIAKLDEAQYFINRIQDLGCTFSLDDFGTGLSSFAYLKNLKVDFLKIDGIFVRDMLTDPVAQSMVSAINQVGHSMQLKTIAEYVENEEIMKKLVDIGVDYGQGFGLGKPQPFEQQLKQLTQSSPNVLT